jgi:uncharacterized protein YbjT (DUF2867 family)
MNVVIAGAHGQVGRRLVRALASRGDEVRGLIRNADHADDVRDDGAEPTVIDLEAAGADGLAAAVEGADAVVFAAGAGPGSGAERKRTLDRDGAVKLLEAAIEAGVPRYVMVSAMGADDPPDGDDVFSVYLRAKAEADRALMQSDLDWTILRPGGLTNDPGTGLVELGPDVERGEVTRDDVATVLAELLHEPRSAKLILALTNGRTPVLTALAAAVPGSV